MRKLLFFFFSVVVSSGTGKADEMKPTQTNVPKAEGAAQLQYQIKVLSFGMVEIGRPILIGIYGSFADEIKGGLDNDTETVRKNLKLYLNDVPMDGLVPAILPPEAALGLKGTDPKPIYVLQFVLDRKSDDDSNRKAWDSLLSQLSFGPQKVQTGVGLNGRVPHLAPANDLQFQVRDQNLIYTVIGFGILLFVSGMVAVVSLGMVREAGPGTPYSLGKTQMAFWGLLVAISFLGVWIIGHRMERIPPQVLILMGISGVTGLGSVLIDKNKTLVSSEGASKTDSGHSWKAWFIDIISDGNGVNFHRFQVVLWTLILAFVFAWTVANTFSMPEFENTLLVLMGISNGLYLGFKIPEPPK